MAKTIGLLSALALSLVSTTASAAAVPSTDCAVLDDLLRSARTEFPTLKTKGFGGARCNYSAKEYSCVWPFGTDHYGDAEDQMDRLQRCTAAEPHAVLLTRKKHAIRYRLNPETTMAIVGPDPENGHWTIQIKLVTTADWQI